jgi:hypothetical protein
MTRANAAPHASLQSYPDAVISATDAASGIAVSVEPDGRSVKAVGGDGVTLWTTDALKDAPSPIDGFAVVRGVEIRAGKTVHLVIGKGAALDLDLRTGKAGPISDD